MSAIALTKLAETTDRAELLSDRRGVYGVVFVPADKHSDYIGFITRPDCLEKIVQENKSNRRCDMPVLQPIPRLKFFRHATENEIADNLFTALLDRAGIQRHESCQGWWSDDPREQAANRRRYHAFKRQAVCITNNLVRQALAVAHQDALHAARRFSERQRFRIYRATATSPRMLQLANTFPLLLDLITTAPEELRAEATRLVEAGARLKVIADFMRLPMAFRRVEPGVTRLARDVFTYPADVVAVIPKLAERFIPRGTAAQRRWWWAQYQAIHIGGPYLEWAARHALELGVTVEQVRAQIHDIGDWAAACYAASAPGHVRQAILRNAGLRRAGGDPAGHIARPFHPDMSVRTVRELCADWHEAVALSTPESSIPLPPPWRQAAQIGALEILPLATAADIIAEGKAMHHCVQTYIAKVCAHECYLFSARQGDKRLATIEVQRFDGGVSISQMRGPCNAVLPKPTQELLRRWCRQRNAWRDQTPSERGRSPDSPVLYLLRPGGIPAAMPADDDEIPF